MIWNCGVRGEWEERAQNERKPCVCARAHAFACIWPVIVKQQVVSWNNFRRPNRNEINPVDSNVHTGLVYLCQPISIDKNARRKMQKRTACQCMWYVWFSTNTDRSVGRSIGRTRLKIVCVKVNKVRKFVRFPRDVQCVSNMHLNWTIINVL